MYLVVRIHCTEEPTPGGPDAVNCRPAATDTAVGDTVRTARTGLVLTEPAPEAWPLNAGTTQ
ncbi:hypothetical protein [Streptomyces sp. NPDC006307]|uniref:hypothetical protein n=1 Tax=Streptomyces sp. NPDC006307 TaxID=3156748 RepID=UPI0033B68E5F